MGSGGPAHATDRATLSASAVSTALSATFHNISPELAYISLFFIIFLRAPPGT